MAFELIWYEHGTCVTFAEQTTLDDINRANEEHYGDSRFDNISYQLFDFNRADTSSISLDDAKYPAALDCAAASYKPKLKVALVVKDQHSKELCQAYIEYARHLNITWEMKIFEKYDQAIVWCESKS